MKTDNKADALKDDIMASFLGKRDMEVIERGYRRKIGEIDIVASRDGRMHFVRRVADISQVTPFFMRKLANTAVWYLAERKVPTGTPWTVDAVCVSVAGRKASVEVLWNISA